MSKRNYEVGDRVEIHAVGEVTDVFDDGSVYVDAPGGPFGIGVAHLALTRKLPPRKPPAGTVIDGKRLKATPWKRGTVIADEAGGVAMLHADGAWRGVDHTHSWGFDMYLDDEPIALVHVA